MIEFNSINDFVLDDKVSLSDWLKSVLQAEGKDVGEVVFIFCNDDYLHDLNVRYLSHDTLTDVISFDYTSGNIISGDIFISVERVRDNSQDFDVDFSNELNRVMVHGILHFCGYKDKSDVESENMRAKENLYLALL